MKKTIQFVFMFILFIVQNNAVYAGETGKIAGHITDKGNKEALIGANVVIYAKWESGVEKKISGLYGGTTDKEGYYFILNIPPGTYNARVSYVGYKQEIITKIRVDVDKTTRVDFMLESEAIQSNEVVITAYSQKTVEPDVTATKQVYNMADVETIAGVTSITDVLDLQADVIDDHFRGGRIGQSSYLLNGATINNPLSNQRSFSPMTTGMQQVEVYTSGFSAEYGNAQSGVVNMIAKEGGESWETRVEGSATAPYYKTFGGSVYNPANLTTYNIMNNDPAAWFAFDPASGKQFFMVPASILGAFQPQTLKDSLAIAKFTQLTWLQSIRKVGLNYADQFDNRFDFSIGGPLSKDIKFFLAARQNVVNPIIPTTTPDLERQVMSNISFNVGKYDKLKLDLIYSLKSYNSFDGGWQDWLFNPTTSVTQAVQTTNHYGIQWQHLFNEATFMDLKMNVLNIESNNNIEIIKDDQYAEIYTKFLQWPNYIGPATFSTSELQGSRGGQNLSTYELLGYLTNQFNKYNLLKSGFQLSYYNLKVNQQQNITSLATVQNIRFNNFPFEGALYLQDKMEFDGFIANIGLRFDFYDMNTNYFSDTYSPLRNPFRVSDSTNDYYSQSLAARAHTKLYTKLQPRIGISFPLSETTVFHLNYGTFTQRPSFTQIYYNQVSSYNDIQFLGNPQLQPENTRAYDIGLVNAFPYSIRFEISAYYKDVTNLVEISNFEDTKTIKYKTYTNREYADIKGVIINIEKFEGPLRGYIRYNYEAAKGKNSNDLVSPVTYSEIAADSKFPDPEDVYLDYDRSHKGIVNVQYKLDSDEGFSFGNIYPLGDMNLSATFRFSSGRPYTWDPNGQGLKYNMRTPAETELRLRLEKKVKIGKTNVTFFGECFNVLNTITYSYGNVFNDPNSTFNLNKWQTNRESIRVYDEFKPYVTDQSLVVISNQPRSFRFGVICRF
jgi:outer membrane receptor protein involved in Fe transport